MVEGRDLVEEAVVEARDAIVERVLDGVEIDEEVVVVEGLAGDADGGEPVMAVRGFGDAIDSDSVGGGESGVDGEFEHGVRLWGRWVRGQCGKCWIMG